MRTTLGLQRTPFLKRNGWDKRAKLASMDASGIVCARLAVMDATQTACSGQRTSLSWQRWMHFRNCMLQVSSTQSTVNLSWKRWTLLESHAVGTERHHGGNDVPLNYIIFSIRYTILYYTILYYTILYYTILYYTILYYTILYYTILYYTILYYTILYYTILYYTILYYTILY